MFIVTAGLYGTVILSLFRVGGGLLAVGCSHASRGAGSRKKCKDGVR